jgi:hypothetical protein
MGRGIILGMRALALSAACLVACGGPEATVVVSNVAGAAAVAGEYEEDEIRVIGGVDVVISIVTEDSDPCILVDVRVCKVVTDESGNVSCDIAAGYFGPDYDVTASVSSFCDDALLVWWSTEAGSGHVETDGDDVHVFFSGRMGPSTAASGTFELSVDAELSTDDVESP